MSDDLSHSHILIIGGYPPPYGGVTVHIKRFHEYCQEKNTRLKIVTQFGTADHPDVISLRGNKLKKLFHLIRIVRSFNGKIIHVHSSRLNNLLWGGWLIHWFGKSKIRVLTNHSGNFSIQTKKTLRNILINRFIKMFDYIICVNDNQQKMFSEKLNVPLYRLPVIPSYIPMVNTSFRGSKEVQEFVKKVHSKVRYLIVTTGYLERYYGYDLLIEAIKKIDMNIGLLFIFYTTSNKQYKKELLPKINSFSNMWYLDNVRSDDVLYLIKKADILVRANSADTYGMVVGDAIQLGTPAIASDVCSRHPGAIIFKNGNHEDLKNKLIDTLKRFNSLKEVSLDYKSENNAKRLVDFYKKIIGNNHEANHPIL